MGAFNLVGEQYHEKAALRGNRGARTGAIGGQPR